MTCHSCRPRRAITIWEVLIVIGIFVLVIALLLPALQETQVRSGRTQCQSRMRELGIALHTAQDTFGFMPSHPAYDCPLPPEITFTKATLEEPSALFSLLPFIDQANMMKAFDLEENGEPCVNTWHQVMRGKKFAAPKVYICPNDPTHKSGRGLIGEMPAASYAFNLMLFGLKAPKIPSSMPDGASVTGMMYERYAQCGTTILNPWGKDDPTGPSAYGNNEEYTQNGKDLPSAKNFFKVFQHKPNAGNCDPYTTQSEHTPGINVLLCDASVKLVDYTVSAATWHAAITPNGKDVVGPDW